MDIDKAASAHAEWKQKFREAIANKTMLESDKIAKDNCCELGLWLHGEGKTQFGGKPQFTELLARHAAFHKEAGVISTLINAKAYSEVTKRLMTGSAYSNASLHVGTALYELKKLLGPAKQ